MVSKRAARRDELVGWSRRGSRSARSGPGPFDARPTRRRRHGARCDVDDRRAVRPSSAAIRDVLAVRGFGRVVAPLISQRRLAPAASQYLRDCFASKVIGAGHVSDFISGLYRLCYSTGASGSAVGPERARARLEVCQVLALVDSYRLPLPHAAGLVL